MDARQYLLQLTREYRRIAMMKQRCNDWRLRALPGGIGYSNTRVQTSITNTMENIMVKVADLETQIDKAIVEYAALEDRIINEIHSLTGKDVNKYIQVLYYKYIPDANGKTKSLAQIAKMMCYSADHVAHLHGQALTLFAEQILNKTDEHL